MKKVLIAIIMLVLCAGCNAKYAVIINKDGTVEESAFLTEDEEFFDNYEKSSIGRVVSFILEPYLDILNNSGYTTENYISSTYGGVTISKTYSSFEDYVNNTLFYNQFTDKINYSKDGSVVTISLIGKFSTSEQDQEKIPVDTGEITIVLPYKVKESTADVVNGDKYTWRFDANNNEEKEIKIVYDESKSYDENYSAIFIVLGIIAILLIILFIVYNNIRKKSESANKL